MDILLFLMLFIDWQEEILYYYFKVVYLQWLECLYKHYLHTLYLITQWTMLMFFGIIMDFHIIG